MPHEPQCAPLTERNLKEYTNIFADRDAFKEQFILDYVWEQQINHEKSQKSYEDQSSSSDSEKSHKTALSDYSRYSIEHGLPSINGSLLIPRSQIRKSKLSEIKEPEPRSRDQKTRKEFSERKFTIRVERCGKPMKEKSLNNDHVQKDSDQNNQKSSKKEKKKFLKKHLRSTRDNLKAERRQSRKRNDSLLASSQIMQNWSSDKLGTSRVTLRSNNKAGLGIFNKGKASEKIKTKGVPDLVFSEIDFLNSNPSRKRRSQNGDDFSQRNASSSRNRRKTNLLTKFRKDEQDATRNSAQDTDETSHTVHRRRYRTSAEEHHSKSLSEEREKAPNSRHYSKPNQPKRPRMIHVESKKAPLSDSSRGLLDDEKSTSSNNKKLLNNYLKSSNKRKSNASYSSVNKKTIRSPGHVHVDKTSKSQDEQNITSSYFASDKKNESYKYASQYNDIQSLSNNNERTNSESSSISQKRRSHKQITSSYFTGNKTQTEREENPFLTKNVDSSPKLCSSAVDKEKQPSVDDCQEDFQVDGQGKMVNNDMELDDDSRCLPVNKNSQNDCASPEENEKIFSNNSCSESEKMVICFDPSWIKRKSSLSNNSSQSQNQNIAATLDNKSKAYQSYRLSHAVIAEGAKIEQSYMKTTKESLINNIAIYNGNKDEEERILDNSFNIEFGNNDDEKTCQEIFAEDTNLDHMNVGPFDLNDAIQSSWPYQETTNENNNIASHDLAPRNISYSGAGLDTCHHNMFNAYQEVIAENKSLHKSHYESNRLMYSEVGEDFFAQKLAVDNQTFQDSNLHSMSNTNLSTENNLQPFEDNQHSIFSNEFPMYDQKFIPRTSTLIGNQFPWSSDNELSNLLAQYNNKELTQVNDSSEKLMEQKTWEDRVDNSQYITAESGIYEGKDMNNKSVHDDDSIGNYDLLDVEGESDGRTNMLACFVWKKHRLH